VLVVGGGVSGLTMSLLLSDLGVRHVVVERHDETARLPKAHIINQRAMEIFRGMGLADAIYAAGAPPQNMSTVAWMTSLTGPTPLHGKRIARTDAWCGDADYDAASPCRATNLPQLRLEPMLREAAQSHPEATVLFGHELLSFADGSEGVVAQVHDRHSREQFTVRADYLVAADGGRTIGPAIGIELHGERDLLDMVSTHFSADLSAYWPDESVVICFSTNPDGEGSLGSGVLLPMGPDVWGAKSPEWQYHSALHTGDPDQFDADLMVARMREMLGLPDLDPQIHSVSRWRFEGIVADRYRAGRVFVVGDAAHRHPPNGGLGLNTAVGDVHNLAWKLAAVLRGDAGADLLDTYEAERRPVGVAVVERALSNWRRHIAIDEALGLAGATPQQGWAALAELFAPDGTQRRAAVAQAVTNAAPEFVGQDIELGYRYTSAAVHGGEGATVPHAWLPGAERVSTLDLVPTGGFALLVAPGDADAWRDAAATTLAQLGAGAGLLTVLPVAGPDPIAESDAVLVRPDRHVAWRACGGPDPIALTRALSTVLARPTKG
jgi:2,4-dichlorophenol 6-monooxygenase